MMNMQNSKPRPPTANAKRKDENLTLHLHTTCSSVHFVPYSLLQPCPGPWTLSLVTLSYCHDMIPGRLDPQPFGVEPPPGGKAPINIDLVAL